MSYLNTLRLHFAGQFQCNVSTVNNDPGHYDNAIFKPSYQAMQGPGMNPPNGWFNPQGDAAFRLLGCTVTAAWTPEGAVPSSDPVTGYIVADADDRVPAKMVDLDSEQQMVSEIWGLQVRIADQAGNTLLSGQFEPAPFLDIWDRATGGGGGDTTAGAIYQSVLTGLVWGDVSASPFLTKLKSASAASGMLSIKINVDGMNLDFTDPNFMCGRIAGTIGPAAAGEPHQLVVGRQFMATAATNINFNFFAPAGGINFFPAVVDKAASCVLLDLGNALSTSTPGGPLNDIGDLKLQISNAGTTTSLGTISAQGPNGYVGNAKWYNETAGIVSLPLTSDQLKLVDNSPLTLNGNAATIKQAAITIAEWSNAAFVRADRFVYRMSPGDAVKIPVYAMQFGRPLAGASIAFTFDPGQLQGQNASIFVTAPPPVAVPVSALQFNATATTDQNGIAILAVKGTDPGSPRLFKDGAYGIDGQVYGIRPAFADSAMNPKPAPINQWNFVSFLLWSSFKPGNPVTWTDLQPVFEQYANLYPVMIRFLNLADYDQVRDSTDLLSLAFGLDVSDPNSMPVTRDLSPAKRQAILAWLQNPLPGTVALRAARAVPADRPAPTGPVLPPGGKAAAAARRLILQKH
jgi:hypothetical protein